MEVGEKRLSWDIKEVWVIAGPGTTVREFDGPGICVWEFEGGRFLLFILGGASAFETNFPLPVKR